MGTGLEIGLAAASLAITAAGTGMAYYGQQQQAQNAERMAQYNYAIQRQNADVNMKMAMQQASLNQQVSMSQYQAGLNNAASLDNQAKGVEAQARERARRMREENQRMLAVQRANYGKAGVSSEGTPLMVMADSAGILELGVLDTKYEGDMEATALRRSAEVERYQAGFSLLDAGVEQYKSAAARTGRGLAMRDAEMNRMAGMSQAQGLRTSSYGTLLSGAGQMASSGYSYYQNMPRRSVGATSMGSSSLGGGYVTG